MMPPLDVIQALEAGSAVSGDPATHSQDLKLMIGDDHLVYQLVLPETLRTSVFKCLHDDTGHMGIDHTVDLG